MATRGSRSTRRRPGALVVAGPDPAFRRRLLQSLAGAGSFRGVEVEAGPDLERTVSALDPAVILLDVGARPDAAAFATVAGLSALGRTIVLAGAADDALAVDALRAGASGFCARDTAAALVRKAVQLVAAGEIWVGRSVMLRLIEELAARRAPQALGLAGARLTAREREIATEAARGASNKEIAYSLSISIKTVKTHLTSVFRKFGVSTRRQLGLALGEASQPGTEVG